MKSTKDVILRQIAARAQREVKQLAGEFARAPSAEKEGILAELQFNRWLAECCQICLD